MKDRSALLRANLKAFLAGWLTASLLFPLVNVAVGTGYGYLFGVMLMLLGLVTPYMLLPCLGAVAVINLIASARWKWFARPIACTLLCGLAGGTAFLLFFLVWHLIRNPAGAWAVEGLQKISVFMFPAATLFGVYYYWFVARKFSPPSEGA